MQIELTDSEILALTLEPKVLPHDYLRRLDLRERFGHDSAELQVAVDGRRFEIRLRQGKDPFDFSAIFGLYLPNGRLFRLRRYNGRSHIHRNKIERQHFFDFHIHEATARYQALGSKEDTFATVTTRYTNLRGALACLISDCAFSLAEPPDGQMLIQ